MGQSNVFHWTLPMDQYRCTACQYRTTKTKLFTMIPRYVYRMSVMVCDGPKSRPDMFAYSYVGYTSFQPWCQSDLFRHLRLFSWGHGWSVAILHQFARGSTYFCMTAAPGLNSGQLSGWKARKLPDRAFLLRIHPGAEGTAVGSGKLPA